MQISKKQRILILIAVDTIFFILEIVIGYTAHSLALVADAFHMLNDIISLCVGYWATDVAENKSSSNEYTYGWARAEILGGLINGVFLIALCVTIILDAIQRFFEVQEVKNPKLVLIVGGIGLTFNIMGLFLFHDHSHSHGGHSHGEEEGHSHDHAHAHSHDELSHAEAGHSDALHSTEEEAIAHGKNGKADHDHGHDVADKSKNRNSVTFGREDSTTSSHSHSQSRTRKESMTSRNRRHSRSYSTIEDLPIHPASLRQDMRTKARFGDAEEADYYLEEEEDVTTANEPSEVTEASPLLSKANATASRRRSNRLSKQGGNEISAVDHSSHKHSTAPKANSGGHSHDENVRGMFLHVLGDALGNVGVMASALIIWLSHWKYRFYFDPAISLFITLIILKSAIPLVRDTARPLLQATPENIQVEDIRADIESLPGIVSCHHIHVWALTRDKLVATLDVQLDFNFEGESGAKRYMELAAAIKSCLRGHNIYSSTVQPEFCMNKDHAHSIESGDGTTRESATGVSDTSSSKDTVVPYQEGGNDGKRDVGHPPCEHGECLLADSRHGGMQCCMPGSGAVTPKRGSKGGNGHGGHDDHGHDHGHEH